MAGAAVVRDEVGARLEHGLTAAVRGDDPLTASMISVRPMPSSSMSGPDRNLSQIPSARTR